MGMTIGTQSRYVRDEICRGFEGEAKAVSLNQLGKLPHECGTYRHSLREVRERLVGKQVGGEVAFRGTEPNVGVPENLRNRR